MRTLKFSTSSWILLSFSTLACVDPGASGPENSPSTESAEASPTGAQPEAAEDPGSDLPLLLPNGNYDARALDPETVSALPADAQVEFPQGDVYSVEALAELGRSLEHESRQQAEHIERQAIEAFARTAEERLAADNTRIFGEYSQMSDEQIQVLALPVPGETPEAPSGGGTAPLPPDVIVVAKTDTALTSADLSAAYNANVVLEASLVTATQRPIVLSGQTVRLKIDGVSVATLVTDTAGKVKYTVNTANLGGGKHDVAWYFDGKGEYKPTSVASKLTVSCVGAPPKLTGTLGNVTPSGALILFGKCLGTSAGAVRIYVDGLPNGFVTLTIDEWGETAVAGFLPPITGVKATTAQLKLLNKSGQASNVLTRPFAPTQELRLLTRGDFPANSCSDAPVFIDSCDTLGEHDCKASFCVDHWMPLGLFGSSSDHYKVTLANGWEYDHHSYSGDWYFKPPHESMYATSPALVGWNYVLGIGLIDAPVATLVRADATIEFDVKWAPAINTWFGNRYQLSLYASGPAGVPYK